MAVGLVLVMKLRTRAGIAAAVAISAVVGIAALLARQTPNGDLRKYLSPDLPPSVVVQEAKLFRLRKDAEMFWLLSHPKGAIDAALLQGFRPSDVADTEFLQNALKDAFPNKYAAEPGDLVYSHDTEKFECIFAR